MQRERLRVEVLTPRPKSCDQFVPARCEVLFDQGHRGRAAPGAAVDGEAGAARRAGECLCQR